MKPHEKPSGKQLNQQWEAFQGSVAAELQDLEEQKIALEKEKEQYAISTKKIASVNFASTIKLDVGGKKFKTSLVTLQKEDSMLARMFSGRIGIKKDEDGYYFIDRPGIYFGPILNYLQTNQFITPSDPQMLKGIQIEVEFYQIMSLMELLYPKRLALHYVNGTQDGIIYWLATKKGTSSYLHPLDCHALTIEHQGSVNPRHVVDRSPHNDGGWCNPGKITSNHLTICLQESVIPSSYSLSHSSTCHPPYNWQLEGYREKNRDWIILKDHVNDNSIGNQGRANFKIDGVTDPILKFRLRSTGVDTHRNCYCFHVNHFEIYGEAILPKIF